MKFVNQVTEGKMAYQTSAKLCGGNIKLGDSLLSWSVLYGDMEHKTPYGIIKGTCSGFCSCCKKDCYVRKSYRYSSVIKRHALNTLAIRENVHAVYSDLHLQLKRKRKPWFGVRINQSGETENMEQFQLWEKLSSDFSDKPFFGYTKNYGVAVSELEKGNVPNNQTVLFSIWGNNGIAEFKKVSHLENVKAFVYVDDVYTVEWYAKHGIVIDSWCTAYDANGKLDHNVTCDKCTKCFNRTHKIIGCHAH